MSTRPWILATLLSVLLCAVTLAAEREPISGKYKALKHSPPLSSSTWAILDRDGARRQVPRYLSSLAGGESGTGVVISPPFKISADAVTFTVCGHDGQGGGRQRNYLALVDVRTGQTLQQTMAPGCDPMQQKSWDVSRLRGREVRIEVHDGDPGNAYAWLGVGQIDAGPAMRVDFRNGMPEGWADHSPRTEPRTEVVRGGVPFWRYFAEYTMIPASGAREIPCGFAAERVFVLGCVAAGAKPAEVYGEIEIVYRKGPPQRCPLLCGYTLDDTDKTLSKSRTMQLHESGDPFQHYLVVATRPDVMEKIILRGNAKQDALARITAVTCQTSAVHDNLQPLPDCTPGREEEAWIRSHAIGSDTPKLAEIVAEIRRAHKLP